MKDSGKTDSFISDQEVIAEMKLRTLGVILLGLTVGYVLFSVFVFRTHRGLRAKHERVQGVVVALRAVNGRYLYAGKRKMT